MKTIIPSLLFACILTHFNYAQNIGINGTGANAHASALLDVDASPSNNKGFLVPRIPLTAINAAAPVTSPALSLLVYNTATASTGTNAVSPGYYYWDGAKWVRFAFNSSGSLTEAWTITGNAGTTPTANFLGTTDNQDLVFKTNNIENVRLLANGNLGVGTNTPLTKLDVRGVISASVGSLLAPAYTFVGDLQTGIFQPSNGELGIVTSATSYGNNNYRARFAPYEIRMGNNLNSLDIGVESKFIIQGSENTPSSNFPFASLGFSNNSNQVGQTSAEIAKILCSSQDATANQGRMELQTKDGTTLATRVMIDKIGNVGISTTSPAEKLTIENGNLQLGELMPAVGLGRKLYFSNTSNQSDDIYLQRENVSSDNSNLQLMLGDNLSGDDKFLIKTTASTTPLLTVVNNGNVGVNTASAPIEKLEVQGSVKIVDGTQGLNKVLTSDATGKATWKQPSGGYRQKYILQGPQTYPNTTLTLMNFPTITIPYTGFYLLNFKSFFHVPNASEYSYYVDIRINGVAYSSDETYTYCDAGYYLNLTDVYTLQANAGDVITLYLNPVIGGVTIDATASTYTRVRFDLLFLGN